MPYDVVDLYEDARDALTAAQEAGCTCRWPDIWAIDEGDGYRMRVEHREGCAMRGA